MWSGLQAKGRIYKVATTDREWQGEQIAQALCAGEDVGTVSWQVSGS